MNTLKLCPILLALACNAVAVAGVRHADATAPVLIASAESVPNVHLGSPAEEAKPTSAGVAEDLPDLPQAAITSTAFRANPAVAYVRPAISGESYSVPLSQPSALSLVQSSPLAGAARLMRAQHFNTDDGSSADAFAICYRVSNRSSVQVIPGDPAPVKIPVSSMANNTGVTVGMVLRLRK